MTNKHTKRYPKSLVIREINNKSTDITIPSTVTKIKMLKTISVDKDV